MKVTMARLGWGVFALHVVAVLAWAEGVRRGAPVASASAAVGADGKRFGLTEDERRRVFRALTRGETADRRAVETQADNSFNGNRDDVFHRAEWRRVPGMCRTFRLPDWTCWWILDEGLHAHWPPEPGVTLYHDDAPLVPRTRPLAQRRIIAATPSTPSTVSTPSLVPPPLPVRPPAPAPTPSRTSAPRRTTALPPVKP